MFRKLSKGGFVTLPAQLRRSMNLKPEDGFDVTEEAGRIILTPYTPRCVFCDSKKEVIKHRNQNVCKLCREEMVPSKPDNEMEETYGR